MKKHLLHKLNLGCGRDKRLGWINIDAIAELNPDVVHDLSQPLPFPDESTSDVLAQDILEHFTKEDVRVVTREIARVLCNGGKLVVRVPNVDDIFDRFSADPEVRNQFLYGTTEETGIFGAHKVGFTPLSLTALMLQHGLKLVSLEAETTNWKAQFEKISPPPRLRTITYINQSLGMGGAEEFMSDVLAELQELGIRVQAYTTQPAFLKLLERKKVTSKCIAVVLDIVGDWKGLIKACALLPKGLWEYIKIIRSVRDTDIVVFSGFTEKIIGSWLCKLWSVPTVWIEFGPLKPLFQKFFRFPKALYYGVKKFPLAVIIPSRHTASHLVSDAHVSTVKLKLAQCGRVDVQENLLKKSQKPELNHIVCVSRLEPGKGQDLLIRAFAGVVKKVPTARLTVVGEGDFRPTLEDLIKKLELHQSVRLAGRVPNALEEMAKASMCVFPSVWPLEGFGLVLIEAMALGKPVIAFDHGPGNEIVINNETGLLVQSGDVDGLSLKIIELLKNPVLRKRLGRRGRQTFLENYTIRQSALRYKSVLEEAYVLEQSSRLLKSVLNK